MAAQKHLPDDCGDGLPAATFVSAEQPPTFASVNGSKNRTSIIVRDEDAQGEKDLDVDPVDDIMDDCQPFTTASRPPQQTAEPPPSHSNAPEQRTSNARI